MPIKLRREDEQLVLSLEGAFDEHLEAALEAVRPRLRPAGIGIIVDCAGVTSVNSVGVRQWVRFLGTMGQRHSISYRHVVALLVEYFQILPVMLRAERVASVEIPYRCTGCGEESRPYFGIKDMATLDRIGPLVCGTCRGTCQPRVVVADYLSFLFPDS